MSREGGSYEEAIRVQNVLAPSGYIVRTHGCAMNDRFRKTIVVSLIILK